MMRAKKFWLPLGAILFSVATSLTFGQQAPIREITRITGELYRFRNSFSRPVTSKPGGGS